MRTLFLVFSIFFALSIQAQTPIIQTIIDEVSLDELTRINREYSGEDSCTINGNRVLLQHRVSNWGNNIAADYLFEYFEALNLEITTHQYRSSGRNIVATQYGIENPDNIYIICGHYDAVADYCADDNVSGVATVLEAARILSKYCLGNTIIYALWDEEEIGLVGSRAFADSLANENANVIGVLNMDMMAYDGNDDRKFDIDVRDIAESLEIKDMLVDVVNDYNLNLEPIIVNPGTSASDHAGFWQEGYSAVLLGESWETNDRNPFYHTANDRVSLYNWPYYHDMAKLAIGYMATVADIVSVNTSIISNNATLTAEEIDVSYQWIDCSNDEIIEGETSQTFTAEANGNYAVILDNGICPDTSDCVSVVISSFAEEVFKDVKVYPNPVTNQLVIDLAGIQNATIRVIDANGRLIYSDANVNQQQFYAFASFTKGLYFIEVYAKNQFKTFVVVKE